MTQPDKPAFGPETQRQWLQLNVEAHSAEISGDLDEAQRLFEQSLKLALQHEMELQCAFSSLCLGNVLLQYREAESYSVALELFKTSLAIRLHSHAPCEWDVAEVHRSIAQTYQLMEQYAAASHSWREFLRCVDWLPDYFPVIRSAVSELCYCGGKLAGMPDPIGYDGISSPLWWQEDVA